MNRLPVAAPSQSTDSYDVLVDPGLLSSLKQRVDAVLPRAGRVLLAVDERIAEDHGHVVREQIVSTGRTCIEARLDASESSKTLQTVHTLYHAMLAGGLDRSDAVVAFGGGIVGDTAGFAAATYLRGVDLVQIPTTLLAMVDASIGGKTGVNLPLPAGGLGKNLAGAFWSPRAVLIDPRVLATLDDRNFRCGLAECVKHGMIASGPLLEEIEAFVGDSTRRDDESALTTLITRSAQVKIDVVVTDIRERGQRALLNLGHTFAHGFESIAELNLQHGEAVSIGLCCACDVAVNTGRMSGGQRDRVQTLLGQIGLPTRLPRSVSSEVIQSAMAFDKKNTGGRRRLIVPVGLGAAEIVEDLPETAVDDALRAVGAED